MSLFRKPCDALKRSCVHSLLIAVSVFIGGCAVLITALYLLKYIDTDTPEMQTLKCFFFTLPECPDVKAEIAALEAKVAALEGLKDDIAASERKLADLRRMEENLRRIENAIDSVTLFKTTAIPGTKMNVVVGSIYSKLVNPDPQPLWFCYIALPDDDSLESRHVYIRNVSIDKTFDAAQLAETGITPYALSFARSLCKPYLIGGAE